MPLYQQLAVSCLDCMPNSDSDSDSSDRDEEPMLGDLHKYKPQPLLELSAAPAGTAGLLSVIDRFAVVADKHPKSRVHLLVMPRAGSGGPPTLRRLARIIDAGQLPRGCEERRRLAAELVELETAALAAWQAHGANAEGVPPGTKPRLGFHALPSLLPLHLHVVSPDFNSPALKTRKHAVSFSHPSYFLPLDAVLASVREDAPAGTDVLAPGAAERAASALKEPLTCPHCGAQSSTVPALKAHLAESAACPPRK